LVQALQDLVEGAAGVIGKRDAAKAFEGAQSGAEKENVSLGKVSQREAGDFLGVTIAAAPGDVLAREPEAVPHQLDVFADGLFVYVELGCELLCVGVLEVRVFAVPLPAESCVVGDEAFGAELGDSDAGRVLFLGFRTLGFWGVCSGLFLHSGGSFARAGQRRRGCFESEG
jgi:hypothetical protein